jgi:hypothetical protein
MILINWVPSQICVDATPWSFHHSLVIINCRGRVLRTEISICRFTFDPMRRKFSDLGPFPFSLHLDVVFFRFSVGRPLGGDAI